MKRPLRKRSTPPTNGHDPILTEARRLHNNGFSVYPTNRDDKKKPKVKWGDRRLGLYQLDRFLADGDTNIAVKLSDAPIPIVDVEYDNEEGKAAFHAMFGDDPQTPAYTSGRGVHYWFAKPDGLPDKSVVRLDGVEVHIGNKNSLSTVPPSIHSNGTVYTWLPGKSIYEISPAPLPEEIVERLRTPAKKQKQSGDGGAIPEGKRNDTLFQLACRLKETGLADESVLSAVLAENAAKCNPPLPESEVGSIVRSAAKIDADEPGSQKPKGSQNIGKFLIALAESRCEFWHSPDGDAFATIDEKGHREYWPVRSSSFRRWCRGAVYSAMGKAIGRQTLEDSIGVFEAKAQFEGKEHDVFLRVGGHEGRIYVDLCDDQWRAIEIDAIGWRIVDNPPVRFRRTKGMRPLVEPKTGGSFADLRPFVNVSDEHWPLLVAWLVSCFRPAEMGPFPILKLIAEHGSGKTFLCRLIRDIVDPHIAAVRSAPSDDRDLMISATNNWLVSWDNLSYISPKLSDSICRLATYGAFATRQLWTDDDEKILQARRPVLVNAIEDVGNRPDLNERALIVELNRIEPSQRKTESELSREFEQAKALILGAILNAVSTALRRLSEVEQAGHELQRMADFSMFSIAAEPALGLDEGEFLSAYAENRASANQTALESSPLVRQLFDVLKKKGGEFEGTATELHDALAIGIDTKSKWWPKDARGLSGMMKRFSPDLRNAGFTIEHGTRGTRENKKKIWILKSPPVEDSAETTKSNNRVTADSLKASLKSKGR